MCPLPPLLSLYRVCSLPPLLRHCLCRVYPRRLWLRHRLYRVSLPSLLRLRRFALVFAPGPWQRLRFCHVCSRAFVAATVPLPCVATAMATNTKTVPARQCPFVVAVVDERAFMTGHAGSVCIGSQVKTPRPFPRLPVLFHRPSSHNTTRPSPSVFAAFSSHVHRPPHTPHLFGCAARLLLALVRN